MSKKFTPASYAAASEADAAVGSRYIKGGGAPDWSFYRWLISRGGNLYTSAISGAPGSNIAWTGGDWTCQSSLALGSDVPLGSSLSLNAGMRLYANGGFHVSSSGRLLVNGGTLIAGSFTYEEGAVLEYASGSVSQSGNFTIGAGGFTGPAGSQTVTLADANDQLSSWSGDLMVTENHILRLHAGSIAANGLVVQGVFDYGGQTLDEPGQGMLDLSFSGSQAASLCIGSGENDGQMPAGGGVGSQAASLRIGSGSGDAVINGRTVVQVGSQGKIAVWGGGLRIDRDHTLQLLEEDPAGDSVGVYADWVELAGILRLENRDIAAFSHLVVKPGGTLCGEGNIFGTVQNDGLVSPGFSPGQIHIFGDFQQLSTGTLRMQIASASEFDQLLVHRQAFLGGTLEIVFLNGFVPGPSDTFMLISAAEGVAGQFDNVVFPGGGYQVAYNGQDVTFSPVPEPSARALAVTALLALGYAARRRSNLAR